MLPYVRNSYGVLRYAAAIHSKYDFDYNFVTKAHRITIPEFLRILGKNCRFSGAVSMMVTTDFVCTQYVKFRHIDPSGVSVNWSIQTPRDLRNSLR
jgi:hypothetical protein